MSTPVRPLRQDVYAVALIARDADWDEVRTAWESARPGLALGREWMWRVHGRKRIVLMHTGEEEMPAAVSAQYAVDRWKPRVLAAATPMDAFSHVAGRNNLPLEQREPDESAIAAWLERL
jgi:hypothetical protein